MYAFERLLAQLQHTDLLIEIHLFNRSPYFGAGDIYAPEQPRFLIMNYHSDNIQMWSEESPLSQTKKQVGFADWVNQIHAESDFPKDYAPRAVVGEYLHKGFLAIKKSAPKNVTVFCHPFEVDNLKAAKNGYWIYKNREKEPITFVHQLLLATGHPRPQITDERTRYHRFASDSEQLSFTDFVYPVTQKLSSIQADSTVLMKGLGLTFIDSVLCLTEGRNGQFIENEKGGFEYKISGEEPRFIFPFSRSGLPMIPRIAKDKQARSDLHYFTKKVVAEYKARKAKIDFTKEVLPLIEQDIIVAYYQRLFQQYDDTLNINADFEQVEQQINTFLKKHNIAERFSLQTLLDPYPQQGDDQIIFLHYLDEVIEAARLQTPLAAAAAVWRTASSGFNELYSFGGFTPLSHQEFLKSYAGHFNRIAYGPPLRNLLKIKALAEAGILDFSFVRSPELHLNEADRCFTLQKGTQAVHGDHLVDARIPKVNLTYEASKLEQSLLKQGIIRLFQNKSEQQQFCPGCMELDKNGHPINAGGETITSITVYGTPTEGITFDNDTLSRQRNNFASCWGKHIAKELEEFNQSQSNQIDYQFTTT